MLELSTKPYFIRAIYEWCGDAGFTPYLSVKVDSSTRVPMAYVKSGEIVLNISMNATRHLTIDSELVQFSARFNGVSQEVRVPIGRVSGIFARENGHGAFFQVEDIPSTSALEDGVHDVQHDTGSDEIGRDVPRGPRATLAAVAKVPSVDPDVHPDEESASIVEVISTDLNAESPLVVAKTPESEPENSDSLPNKPIKTTNSKRPSLTVVK